MVLQDENTYRHFFYKHGTADHDESSHVDYTHTQIIQNKVVYLPFFFAVIILDGNKKRSG